MPAPSHPARARSRARTALRWTGRVAVALLAFVSVTGAAGYALSERRLHRRFATPNHPLAVTNDAATVARGRYLATTRGCVDCHGDNLGGRVMIDAPMIGRVVSANLTRGGRGAALADGDWELAVRHGLRRDGSPLFVMPAQELTGMSDEDLAAIVAYARTLPGVSGAVPAQRAGPVFRALHLAGQVPLLGAEMVDHGRPHPRHVTVEATAAYGHYLAQGCTGCHGAGYGGGKIPGAPPEWGVAANLTPAGNVGRWSEGEFVHALRTGARPDGSRIDGTAMPLKVISQMDTVELRALYRYFRTLPPRPFGSR